MPFLCIYLDLTDDKFILFMFYIINNFIIYLTGFNTYTYNDTAHTEREPDEILSVSYEDGKWSKPYYDCGGGNIWMLTYTVPFFGYNNGTYFFK